VLQGVAVCCSIQKGLTDKMSNRLYFLQNMLQCVAVCCSVLQCIVFLPECCSVFHCVAVWVAECCSVLQCVAVCCSIQKGLTGDE